MNPVLVIKTDEGHHFSGKTLQTTAFGIDVLQGFFLLLFGNFHMEKRVGIADNRSHGRLELMGQTSQQLTPPLGNGLQLLHLFLHLVRHPVESHAHLADLVISTNPTAPLPVTPADGPRGVLKLRQRF